MSTLKQTDIMACFATQWNLHAAARPRSNLSVVYPACEPIISLPLPNNTDILAYSASRQSRHAAVCAQDKHERGGPGQRAHQLATRPQEEK